MTKKCFLRNLLFFSLVWDFFVVVVDHLLNMVPVMKLNFGAEELQFLIIFFK